MLFGPFRRSFFGTCSVLFHYCHLNLVFMAQHRRQPNRQTHKRIPEELCLALPRASLRSKTNKRWHVIPGVIWINGHIFIYLVFFCLFLCLFWFFLSRLPVNAFDCLAHERRLNTARAKSQMDCFIQIGCHRNKNGCKTTNYRTTRQTNEHSNPYIPPVQPYAKRIRLCMWFFSSSSLTGDYFLFCQRA